MAKATKTTKTIERQQDVFTVELSRDEADFLYTLLHTAVAGDEFYEGRYHTISAVLKSAGANRHSKLKFEGWAQTRTK